MISFSKILTIVVPSFNMEALLRKGLQSLLIEKNPQRLEVIVVNDGSTDQTLAIAKEFHSRFPQTFTFIDKENGNYGSCINAGLKIAQGKYIKILDADDYVDNCFYILLYLDEPLIFTTGYKFDIYYNNSVLGKGIISEVFE